MKKALYILILASFIAGCNNGRKNTSQKTAGNLKYEDLAKYVNPFIGTGGHGHTYPGASAPFGMVQLSPDTRLEGWDGCSGYHYSDSVVFGFSHTHLSGTGVPDYADILFMPTVGKVMLNNGAEDPDKGYASRFSHKNEKASPGYYSNFLDDYGIKVELTASKRAGFHKYTFPAGDESNIIIDLKHRDKVIESWFRVVSNTEVEGFRRSTAWANDQYIYFVAKFSKPFKKYGIAKDDKLTKHKELQGGNIKAFLTFDTKENEDILVKVGISAVNAEGAWDNMEKEIPGWNFEKTEKEVRNQWNAELNKIVVSGGTEEQKTIFYTALYHAFLVPNLFMDVDGDYRGRDLKVHTAKGFDYYTVFSLWDTFRGEHPLFTLTQQKRTIDFIKTMITQYEQGGRLPVWELAGNETECMIGYHSVPVIVDAYMKGLRDFDIEKAYEAMKHSADLDLFGLRSYKKYGYIPAEDESESVSKTLEYAYDDWCIAQMAKSLGKEADYKRFIKRAQSYKNIYDPTVGFMRAKMNGRWFSPFDPREVNFNFTEANSWQYSFFVPQDIDGLIQITGGKETFDAKLDSLFGTSSETTGREQSDITGLIGQYAHGNEPSHHMAYLYDYIGKPWKTQQRVREIMDNFYENKPDGLCGNEDCGQMSAWYILSATGFYPVTPGSNIYAIGTPLFPEIQINMENGKTFTVKAVNVSSENIYIRSATLNGKPFNKCFLTHNEIANGGEIVFKMGPEPNKSWGTGEGNIPVSAINDYPIVPVPFVTTGDKTFFDSTVVSLGTIEPGNKIYYTLDGSVPDKNSHIYEKPFILKKSATLNAIAYRSSSGSYSSPVSVHFSKMPKNRKITLKTKPENQYSAGGETALIDFIRGTKDFRTGAWQGYEGVDIDATVDLGSIQLIRKIDMGFLQDNNAWIFFPQKVDFYISMNGKDFQNIGTVTNDISPKKPGTLLKDFSVELATKARYVRVVAKNMGLCPQWHKGAGNKAWIFADEIVIE